LALVWLAVLGFTTAPAWAATTGKISKVLTHFVDRNGRHTLAPSLYERDAYQDFLRRHPEQCAGLRFDVLWKADPSASAELRLRIEVRGGREAETVTVEQAVRRRPWYDRWSRVNLDGERYRAAGQVLAWRVTLWDGDSLLAEYRSFLW
jgi:hypothetical protein